MEILAKEDFEILRLLRHEDEKLFDDNLGLLIETEVFRNIGRFAVDI